LIPFADANGTDPVEPGGSCLVRCFWQSSVGGISRQQNLPQLSFGKTARGSALALQIQSSMNIVAQTSAGELPTKTVSD
jgi:hypothetical protein